MRLAHLFEAATGLDLDPGMIAEGRRAAEQQKRNSIFWVRAQAEDLPDAAPGPFRLVTFGQSLHWTDEEQVVETVYDMVEPGGAIAAVVHTVEGRPVPRSPGPPPIPHAEIEALIESYLGPVRRAGQGVPPVRAHRIEDVIARTRFGPPRIVFAPGEQALVRDTESVVSGYLSMSFAAPHLFGDQLKAFTTEVRAILSARSADGLFWDWPGDTEVILAVKWGSLEDSSQLAKAARCGRHRRLPAEPFRCYLQAVSDWVCPAPPTHSPGPDVGPIRPILQGYLDHFRRTLLRQCAGLTGEQLTLRAVPPSSLSLLGLVRHLTEVERVWLRVRAAGETLPAADRDGQFEPGDPADAPAVVAALTAEWALCDAAVAGLSLDHELLAHGEPVSLASLYVHLIEE